MQISATAKQLPPAPLKITKRNGLILTSDILDVMAGRSAALHVKRAASQETCDTIVDNFKKCRGVFARKDGVPGKYIGSSHFKKAASDYFTESALNKPHIQALLGDVVDPIRSVFSLLSQKLRDVGGSLHRAGSERGEANYCRALCWTGTGPYALKPHDDVAQVQHAGDGYEFTNAAKNAVVALNFYPSMPTHGGDLRIWNFKPTPEDKRSAGIELTGYPYGEELLADREYWDLGISVGDLVLINGGYVHAVTRQSNEGHRILLHAFIGFTDNNTAVWWT